MITENIITRQTEKRSKDGQKIEAVLFPDKCHRITEFLFVTNKAK